jgi:murein DD-endopeptidase MepM/ murein hydrolase activator NlpD
MRNRLSWTFTFCLAAACACSVQAAGPSVIVSSSVLLPGQTLRVEMDGLPDHGRLTARWLGKTYRFFAVGPAAQRLLLSVPLGTHPAHKTLAIQRRVGSRWEPVQTLAIEIATRTYTTENVNFRPETSALMDAEHRESLLIGKRKRLVTAQQFWEGRFQPPVEGPMIGEFGLHRLRNGTIDAGYHKGVDLRAPKGRAVQAANAGTVILASHFRAHGNTILLDHGQGVMSIYLHMSRLRVKPGERVTKGQTIGDVGSTGLSTAPHVHWQIYVQGVPVDPAQWLENEY